MIKAAAPTKVSELRADTKRVIDLEPKLSYVTVGPENYYKEGGALIGRREG